MDEQRVREHAEAHGQAVVDGDMDAVANDLIEELRPSLPAIGRLLPRPVTAANVDSLESRGEEAVAHIRYSGDDAELVIRSTWAERDGRPMIIAAEPLQADA